MLKSEPGHLGGKQKTESTARVRIRRALIALGLMLKFVVWNNFRPQGYDGDREYVEERKIGESRRGKKTQQETRDLEIGCT